MNECPQCGTQYSDLTLKYCLQDGTPLIGPDTPTAVLGETETLAARRGGERINVPITGPNPRASELDQATAPEKSSTNTMLAVVATAVGMLVLFGIAGVAALIYFRSATPSIQNAGPNISSPANRVDGNSKTVARPVTSPSGTPARSAATVSPSRAAVEDPQVTSEVSQSLDSWRSQSESLNVNAYMSHYAPVVDYYNKPGSSAAYIRADKMRAFSRYSSIRVNLTNITVTADPSGRSATATFDKEWDFEGNGSSSGKVRQMMRLSKINGQWLITAEKDLKLYYKR